MPHPARASELHKASRPAILQLLFLFTGRTEAVLFWVLIPTCPAGSMAVAVIGWSMLADPTDPTDVEHYRTGQRREGALNDMASLTQT